MSTSQNKLLNPIIIDIGSAEVKAGIAEQGVDIPKLLFPNTIGQAKYHKVLRSFSYDDDLIEEYIGQDCNNYKGILKLRYPVKYGIFEDTQDIPYLFNYIFNQLKIKRDEIKEHPILLSEIIFNPLSNREALAQSLFEHFNVPAISFNKQPLLSLFSSGNTTGTVLESGADVTQCCSVYDGNAINDSFIKNDYGGRNVTEYLQRLLKYSGYSLNTSAEYKIVEKIKELCYFGNFQSKGTMEVIQSQFILPDNSTLTIKEEKLLAPEILFDPTIIGLECLSFIDMIMTSMSRVDSNLRSTGSSKFLFSGGNTLFKGIKEKFAIEYKARHKNQPKFISAFSAHKTNSCWVGGNVIAQLDGMQKMWITKVDWKEKGTAVLQ